MTTGGNNLTPGGNNFGLPENRKTPQDASRHRRPPQTRWKVLKEYGIMTL